ncbi:MAG: outer membrane lipoprotein-sorting protein [Candidatus Aminicenantes bacterium]|nr:MAG: outer membrane lipoprotein-sorting protein [Candidatus Aminicenantes bacterium]
MKRILSLCLLNLFLLSLVTSPGLAQKASDILEKSIKAQGGREALEAVKDQTLSGNFEMPMMGISGSMTMYQKEPNKTRMDAELMGMVFTQAFDGETAWMINPQTGGVEELSELATKYQKREALGSEALLHPEKHGITYTFKGKEKIDDKDCLVLEQTFSDGYKTTIYIDSSTYLTYKSTGLSLNQMEVEVETETVMSDYKKVNGMMIPHTITIFQEGEEFMTVTITKVDFNTGLEDSLFKMSE